eukprot:15354138-Alexandrium_andersonii.AAC.1
MCIRDSEWREGRAAGREGTQVPGTRASTGTATGVGRVTHRLGPHTAAALHRWAGSLQAPPPDSMQPPQADTPQPPPDRAQAQQQRSQRVPRPRRRGDEE